MKFSAIFILGSLFAVASAATVASTTASTMKLIMDDLTKISHLYTKTIAAIDSLPQAGVQGAAIVHDHETRIETLFGNVIDNLEILPMPVSQTNAKKIINLYQSFTPAIINSLNGINAKASDFVAIDAASTMSLDLLGVAKPCARFATLILSITPTAMADDVNTMFDQLTIARDNASAALASAMSA